MENENNDVNESNSSIDNPENSESQGGDEEQKTVAQLQKEIETLKQHLRHKTEKQRQKEAEEESDSEATQKDDESKNDKLKDQNIEKIVESIMTQKLSQNFEGRVIDWVYQQEWGKRYKTEQDIDSENYKQLRQAYKVISTMKPVYNEQDAKRNYQLADLIVQERLASSKSADEIDQQKAMDQYSRSNTGGYSGSNSRDDKEVIRLTPQEQRMLEGFGGEKAVEFYKKRLTKK